jgi:hypothetical protein
MQRVSSLRPARDLRAARYARRLTEVVRLRPAHGGKCDENSPHCHGGRQGEKAHKGATNFAGD